MKYRVWELVSNKAVTNVAAEIWQAYEWRDDLACKSLAAGLDLNRARYGIRKA